MFAGCRFGPKSPQAFLGCTVRVRARVRDKPGFTQNPDGWAAISDPLPGRSNTYTLYQIPSLGYYQQRLINFNSFLFQ